MSQAPDEKELAQLDEDFKLLLADAKGRAAHDGLKLRDKEWKEKDPESYKQDMADMCKAMFGERWEVEYKAMLLEEFPEVTEE
jgi:hypothetical protein